MYSGLILSVPVLMTISLLYYWLEIRWIIFIIQSMKMNTQYT